MRLFISSPSDVMAERARVDAVAARLNPNSTRIFSIQKLWFGLRLS